ncbi:unnamed protein product [Tetraodon nigroviridis]|uniref:A-kinase anchoring protein 19 n=1 Tax=Tetraodon nigroviridis TaxID=99883 RepID=SMAKA_TETNG|nr:RecName: Full=Small membrane A-kinase anchor protein; Short=Small membrane AKAP; Short=smAKAP [Tetraodon nigroviridis]CAG08287.1 unnamed protein product [Tetraodon nigroviridis]
MGCVKSKKSAAEAAVGGAPGEKARLVGPEEARAPGAPQAGPVLLDYAQRLSEEIVVRAVQQWAELDRRYGDIPYIECDAP